MFSFEILYQKLVHDQPELIPWLLIDPWKNFIFTGAYSTWTLQIQMKVSK